MAQALVIGCGISGLSSAIRLLENGFTVKIISRELPQDSTSFVAGAIWAGHVDSERQKQWSIRALKVFQEQAKDDQSGVLITRFHEVYYHPVAAPWFKDLLDYCEPMPADKIPAGYLAGYISDVPLVQTPTYLDYLLRRFYELGGTLEQREIQSLTELSREHRLIINCTGVYARHVARDAAVHAIWGQVVLVDAPHIRESIMDDHNFTYVFPRKDAVVLGGIHLHERQDRDIDAAVTADIIERCQKLVPEIGEADIIIERAGLRPGRYEVRLEKEQLKDNCCVIHNYGHGGIGYTLSWGCAEEVLTLAKGI